MRDKLKIVFTCTNCGLDDQDKLTDKKKSTDNWKVNKEKCPKCNHKITIKILP